MTPGTTFFDHESGGGVVDRTQLQRHRKWVEGALSAIASDRAKNPHRVRLNHVR